MLAIILAVFAGCFVLERCLPGWRLPASRGWWWRVLAINGVQLAVVTAAGFTWERWARSEALFHLGSALPAWAGGALAYFIATFVFYWWHRARHEVNWLWLGFHQIHHSPARLEVITSFYKHPVEMTVNSIIGSVLVYVLLGLSPVGGAIYTLFTALGEFFYHTNVRTPRWVGRVFQRPEMHPHPPRSPAPSQQLRRHRLVGHAVRHLRESADVGCALRLRRRPRAAARRHAAPPRRPRAAARPGKTRAARNPAGCGRDLADDCGDT